MTGHGICHRLAWWAEHPADGPAGHIRLVVPDGGPALLEVGLVGSDIVGPGASCVLVTDHSVPPPTGGGLEVRASGLWAEVVVEEEPASGGRPVDEGPVRGHVGVGLEAFGVALGDPDDAWRGGPDHQFRGDRVPVGLDLGGEAVADPVIGWWGIGVPCRVAGEVLVADRAIDVDGWGWWVIGPAGPPTDLVMARESDGGWVVADGGWSVDVPVGRAPVLITDPDGAVTRVDRRFGALVHGDGRRAVGWIEVGAG